MSTELREAIEAAIQIHDDGDGAPVGRVIDEVAPEFGTLTVLRRMIDLHEKGEIHKCVDGHYRVTPERNERLKTDGGNRLSPSDVDRREDAFRPADEVIHASPDPKTAHPADLLGRRVAIDFGSNVREGEIRQVKDHAVQGRWISAKPSEGGMILADPDEHDVRFVDGGRDE